jgi:dihydroorotase
MHFDLLVKHGTAVTPMGTAVADIGIRASRIAAIGAPANATADTVIDAKGLHVLPGLIDPHVHFREPGGDGVENIESGTHGAVLGGIACVFDMPNTTPSITSIDRVDWKRGHIADRAWCDMGFYVGAAKSNIASLADLETQASVCGIKVFAGSSTGDLLVEDDASLEAVMRSGQRRISYHSEDEYRLQARKKLFASGDPYAKHAEWRDEETAFLGTRRLLALARKTHRPAHILHVSTAEELEYLRDHRDLCTVEVLVNHLTQVAPDAYEALGAYAVMNPPIRDRRHYDAAWAAVRDGTVDTIGSDHAPHSKAAKARPWPDTAAGLTGVQTLLPVMLDHVNAGRLTLERLVDLLGAGPARVYGLLRKGRLAAGYDGDLTLVDMQATRTIEAAKMASPCGWTPFDGMRVTGWPVATVVRGNVVMRDGAVSGAPVGQPALFAGTAAG